MFYKKHTTDVFLKIQSENNWSATISTVPPTPLLLMCRVAQNLKNYILGDFSNMIFYLNVFRGHKFDVLQI